MRVISGLMVGFHGVLLVIPAAGSQRPTREGVVSWLRFARRWYPYKVGSYKMVSKPFSYIVAECPWSPSGLSKWEAPTIDAGDFLSVG